MGTKAITKILGICLMIGSLVCMGVTYVTAQDETPQYVPGEVLVKFTEGTDPGTVLQEVGIEAAGLERIHSIKHAVSKHKKFLVEEGLEKDADGWYWFRGKQYKR